MRKPIFWELKNGIRLLLAVVVLSCLVAVLDYVHDYPRTKQQINLIRQGNAVAAERPWIAMSYFFEEAGNGIKFYLTGNLKYMRDYPSEKFKAAQRLDYYKRLNAAAHNNNWQAQMEVARQYYRGDGKVLDKLTALFWLQAARENAPADKHIELDNLITQVKQATQNITPPESSLPK